MYSDNIIPPVSFKRLVLLVILSFFITNIIAQDSDTVQISNNELANVDLSAKLENEPLKKELPWFANAPDDLAIDRLKCIQKDIKLTYNRTIKGFINYFSVRRPQYCLVMERRKNLYFPIFEKILVKNGIPEEMKYLAIVESGLNPRAVSRVGAVGLWQFMPVTGRQFGLMINEYIDERMDPVKSTEAACKYLNMANSIFKDWELSIASYNCGMGHVRRSIRRSGYADTFWDVYDYLPQETRSYVPQYVAVNYVMNYLKEHNIVADSIEAPIKADTIMLKNQYVNIPKLCSVLGVCMEEFLKLNPAIQKNYLPPHLSHFPILIPRDKMWNYISNALAIADSCSSLDEDSLELPIVARIGKPNANQNVTSSSKKFHVVKRGQTIYRISTMYGVTAQNIKAWNNLNSTNLRAGQRLIIHTKEKNTTNITHTSQTNSNRNNVPSSRTAQRLNKHKIHYVQPGDTLWNISQRYDGISVSRIKKLNKLRSNSLKVGQKLIIG